VTSPAAIDNQGAQVVADSGGLTITMGDAVPDPPSGRNLLLGFHFGPRVHANPDPALVSIGIDPIGTDDQYECWWCDGDVELSREGNATIAQCDDFAAISIQVPDMGPGEFRDCTYRVYHELMRALQATGHQQLVRIWNYFGDINVGDGDEEKYRQFSIGRALVFEELGMTDETIPAGTAIGSVRGSPFSVIALATSHSFRSVENPRQVSAFRYPRDYGPKSPKFSRAGRVSVDDLRLFLVSGTAAIIGHTSVHEGDIVRQCDETLNNLQELCDAMSGIGEVGIQWALGGEAAVRVYIRHRSDYDYVVARLKDFLGEHADSVAFLHADICRRELQLEIDASKIMLVPG
jgi:chorismate lyase/3-hydroxybenzoate synthase